MVKTWWSVGDFNHTVNPLYHCWECKDLQDTTESIPERESIHERIQSELRNEDKKEVSQAEEMLELPLVWSKVQDLMMDDGDKISDQRNGREMR